MTVTQPVMLSQNESHAHLKHLLCTCIHVELLQGNNCIARLTHLFGHFKKRISANICVISKNEWLKEVLLFLEQIKSVGKAGIFDS